MGLKCWVFGCRSGYAPKKNEERSTNTNISFHKCPNETVLPEWRAHIPKRDRLFELKDAICSKHFTADSFRENYTTQIGTDTHVIQRERRKLKDNVYPTVFEAAIDPRRYAPSTPKRAAPQPRGKPTAAKRKKSQSNTRGAESESDVPSASTQDEPTPLQDTNPLLAEKEPPPPPPPPLFKSVLEMLPDVKLPNSAWSTSHTNNFVAFSHSTLRDGAVITDKCVVFTQDNKSIVTFHSRLAKNYEVAVSTVGDLNTLLYVLDCLVLCKGSSVAANHQYAEDCEYTLKDHRHKRCRKCDLEKRREAEKVRYGKKRKILMPRKKAAKRQKVYRTKAKLRRLEEYVTELRQKCEQMEEEVLEKLIKNLPDTQKEAVRACIQCAKKKSPHGNRYNQEWIYECMLMRIKGPALYKHIRRKNILAVPSFVTLRRYMRKLRPMYGFQQSTFKVMAEKAKHMSINERRGVLSADEMSLTPDAKFNIDTLEMDGFVNLGEDTPESQKGELGDHGLVLMFRPFMGPWVQALACFLGKNNCPGDVLAKIMLEATILLENSGYCVDAIVTDGASWNKTMWSAFGVDREKGEYCVAHPCTESSAERKLRFLSDFPHLIKCLRNFVLSAKEFKTPEGVVKLEHWRALAREEEKKGAGLRCCEKFSSLHVNVNNLLKMNVALAFQFFSNSVAAAMLLYKSQNVPELQDCDATVAFIKRINKFIDIMNSRVPREAMYAGKTEKVDFLKDMLVYLDDWEKVGNPTNAKRSAHFLSSQSLEGMRVSIKSTLDLFDFLTGSCSFLYLLTDRLNQDCVENYFGHLRGSGGDSDHPTPTQFVQLFRLMQLYSLVKPPRGSNVSGGELLNSLMTTADLTTTVGPTGKERMESKLDELFDDEIQLMTMPEVSLPNSVSQVDIDRFAVGRISGYVAKTAKKRWARACTACQDSITGDGNLEEDLLTVLRSYGFLTFPSRPLVNLIRALEEIVMVELRKKIHRNVLLSVMDGVGQLVNPPLLGCPDHQRQLTKAIMLFYITTRMYFVSRITRKCNETIREKSLRKQAKLATTKSKAKAFRKTSKLVRK